MTSVAPEAVVGAAGVDAGVAIVLDGQALGWLLERGPHDLHFARYHNEQLVHVITRHEDVLLRHVQLHLETETEAQGFRVCSSIVAPYCTRMHALKHAMLMYIYKWEFKKLAVGASTMYAWAHNSL